MAALSARGAAVNHSEEVEAVACRTTLEFAIDAGRGVARNFFLDKVKLSFWFNEKLKVQYIYNTSLLIEFFCQCNSITLKNQNTNKLIDQLSILSLFFFLELLLFF